jgi:hypothetical protein
VLVVATCLFSVAFSETLGAPNVGLAISNSIQVGVAWVGVGGCGRANVCGRGGGESLRGMCGVFKGCKQGTGELWRWQAVVLCGALQVKGRPRGWWLSSPLTSPACSCHPPPPIPLPPGPQVLVFFTWVVRGVADSVSMWDAVERVTSFATQLPSEMSAADVAAESAAALALPPPAAAKSCKSMVVGAKSFAKRGSGVGGASVRLNVTPEQRLASAVRLSTEHDRRASMEHEHGAKEGEGVLSEIWVVGGDKKPFNLAEWPTSGGWGVGHWADRKLAGGRGGKGGRTHTLGGSQQGKQGCGVCYSWRLCLAARDPPGKQHSNCWSASWHNPHSGGHRHRSPHRPSHTPAHPLWCV